MRKYILEFCRRGLIASGIGPLVLAIVYLVAQHHASVLTLTVNQVCMGIFSLSALAFIAGGMNVIYQIERLPLMAAISIHSCVLYLSYLVTYLLNDWLAWGVTPILVFSGIFLVGFVGIWAIIYSCIKRNTDQVNEILKKKLHNAENINE
jgi:hypothetical protein